MDSPSLDELLYFLKKSTGNIAVSGNLFGGDKRDRTADLLNAIGSFRTFFLQKLDILSHNRHYSQLFCLLQLHQSIMWQRDCIKYCIMR